VDERTFQDAKARAFALCRAAVESGIDANGALEFIGEPEGDEQEALAALFMAIGAFQEIGAALLLPEPPRGISVPRSGGVVVPAPSNVR
jgi:hypothetical protein